MKKINRLIIAVFIVTCVMFGFYTGSSYMSRDTEGPVITMKKDTIEASIEDSDKTLLKGIKAEDKKDGDVSDSLIIESMQMERMEPAQLSVLHLTDPTMFPKHPAQ